MRSTSDRILLNCDIGERGPDHPTDLELIRWIDIANIACGGHAGDRTVVNTFSRLAADRGIATAAHLSYPDPAGFGRRRLEIPLPELLTSLEEQYALLPDTRIVKFHGALYNESCRNPDLAQALADWLTGTGCSTVITMPDSALALTCREAGVEVSAEAFAERRYTLDTRSGTVSLVGRDRADASIHDLEEAVAQAENIILRGKVRVLIDDKENTTTNVPLRVNTICVHSDSVIAVPLARELARLVAR